MVSFSFFKGPIRNYKYKSGAQKRKEKLRKEVLQKSQTNNVDNFVVNDIENQFDIESNENEKTSSNVNENEELNQTVNENEKSSSDRHSTPNQLAEKMTQCCYMWPAFLNKHGNVGTISCFLVLSRICKARSELLSTEPPGDFEPCVSMPLDPGWELKVRVYASFKNGFASLGLV
ncbi:hypothetical protein G4B88_018772 [Cannabis sativa]|uniref:Uncharacterized protein n=1 Tax=Cannabis sativa TaxID=3483 RepID=A0A7J6I1C3_CANSA|nr:hypothetical protein G4B88_018772 [Cannabis sativa]